MLRICTNNKFEVMKSKQKKKYVVEEISNKFLEVFFHNYDIKKLNNVIM